MRESSLDYHGKLYHFGELIWLQHAVDQLVHDIRLTHTHTHTHRARDTVRGDHRHRGNSV